MRCLYISNNVSKFKRYKSFPHINKITLIEISQTLILNCNKLFSLPKVDNNCGRTETTDNSKGVVPIRQMALSSETQVEVFILKSPLFNSDFLKQIRELL